MKEVVSPARNLIFVWYAHDPCLCGQQAVARGESTVKLELLTKWKFYFIGCF